MVLEQGLMRTTLLALLFGIVACSHTQPAPQASVPASGAPTVPTEAVTTADDEPAVDPTLPSWAPRSCTHYHAVVVRALACGEIAQGTRDLIKQTYDTRTQSWQALQDAPQGKIAEIGKQCTGDAQLVRAEHAGKCGATAER